MNNYDPLKAPDPDSWLELDEQTRIALVQVHHQSSGVELENETLHAVIHTIVENQLALQEERVHQVLGRLMKEGLDRHDALHAIGGVLAEHLSDLLQEGAEDTAAPESYFRALAKLTASKWRAK